MLRFSASARPGRRRPTGPVRVLILAVSILLLALAAVGVFGYFYAGGHPVTLTLSAFAPYLLLAALPAFAGFLVIRQWVPAVVALAALVLLVVVQAPLYRAADAPPGGTALVVMTANLKIGTGDPAAVVRVARARHVDVLMAQELTAAEQKRLTAAGLDEVLPYSITAPAYGARGTGLWSRYPLTNEDWPPLSFNRVVARVTMPGMPVRPTLVALHVGGPIPRAVNWGLDLKRLPDMLDGLPAGAPVVVGGDFNATHSTPQFRNLLRRGYADAADQAGAGMTRTYPADSWLPPLLGIDHVLSRGAVATSADTVTIPGSDHRALIVRVDLRAADTR